MNDYRKIANENHEEAGTHTTRSVSRHGLSSARRRVKKYYNRIAKRAESRRAMKENVQDS